MSSKLETRVIQVTNISPATTKDQLKTLFQFIGRIRDIKVFPPE
jgi:arginine/serine-rich splicing factor 12